MYSKSIKKTKKTYGTIIVNGIEYTLTELPYLDGEDDDAYKNGYHTFYSAHAICDETPDQIYIIRWEILNEYNPVIDDECNACKWNYPSKVLLEK